MNKFKCSAVYVTAECDNWENGCLNITNNYTMSAPYIQGNNIEELKASICKHFGFDLDGFCEEYEGEPNRLDYQRQENEEGEEPTDTQWEAFKKGEIDLYFVTYSFYFEETRKANIWE